MKRVRSLRMLKINYLILYYLFEVLIMSEYTIESGVKSQIYLLLKVGGEQVNNSELLGRQWRVIQTSCWSPVMDWGYFLVIRCTLITHGSLRKYLFHTLNC